MKLSRYNRLRKQTLKAHRRCDSLGEQFRLALNAKVEKLQIDALRGRHVRACEHLDELIAVQQANYPYLPIVPAM